MYMCVYVYNLYYIDYMGKVHIISYKQYIPICLFPPTPQPVLLSL